MSIREEVKVTYSTLNLVRFQFISTWQDNDPASRHVFTLSNYCGCARWPSLRFDLWWPSSDMMLVSFSGSGAGGAERCDTQGRGNHWDHLRCESSHCLVFFFLALFLLMCFSSCSSCSSSLLPPGLLVPRLCVICGQDPEGGEGAAIPGPDRRSCSCFRRTSWVLVIVQNVTFYVLPFIYLKAGQSVPWRRGGEIPLPVCGFGPQVWLRLLRFCPLLDQ